MSFDQEYTEVPDGKGGTILQPNFVPPRSIPADGASAERAYPCWVCRKPFRESDLQWFRGVPYGIPCGDHKDIQSTLREERAGHYRPPQSDTEEQAEIIIRS